MRSASQASCEISHYSHQACSKCRDTCQLDTATELRTPDMGRHSYFQFIHPWRMTLPRPHSCGRDRNRTQKPQYLPWHLSFMIRTNKKLNNLILKTSGGRISGTVSYIGKLIGTLAGWTRACGRCPSLFIWAGAVMRNQQLRLEGQNPRFNIVVLTGLALWSSRQQQNLVLHSFSMQKARKMLGMSTAVFFHLLYSYCVYTGSCIVGLVSTGWCGMQSGKQTKYASAQETAQRMLLWVLSPHPLVTSHRPLCHIPLSL